MVNEASVKVHMANKVIARQLKVSVRTVENRRHRIFEKLQTDSLAELVRLVVELRMLGVNASTCGNPHLDSGNAIGNP